MKQEKQDYLNGYELSKLHGFIKANGDMHEHGSVPKHLSYWAEKGYIAGIDKREFKRDLILYFKFRRHAHLLERGTGMRAPPCEAGMVCGHQD